MQKQLKIVHVVEGFIEGGVVELVFQLVNLPNVNSTIIYSHRGKQKMFENLKTRFNNSNINFIEWKNAQRKINFIKDIRALYDLYIILKKLKKQSVDIIHLHSSKAGFLGRAVAYLLKMNSKVIYTPHGISFLMTNKWLKKNLYLLIEKAANLLGGTVCAVSESEKKLLESKGIKCTHIYNGVEINNNLVLNKKVETNEFIIVTVARIVNQKNPKLFNNIAKAFLSIKNIKFIWVGDGDLKHLLNSSNIIITGWLKKMEVLQQLENSNIYLSSSHYEGFSFSVLEAMSSSLPLVLTNCIGNSDAVQMGINGYLFKTQEEAIEYIQKLYKDQQKCILMGENSKKILHNNFNMNDTIEQYQKLYYKIIQA